MDRFFLQDPPHHGTAVLTDEEAHHLLHVLRGKPGEQVVLFDGRGSEYTAEIVSTTRRDVQLRILESRSVCRERKTPLTLAVTLPKGDRQKWLVEKLTELGVTRLISLATQRSVATAERGTLVKLRRCVIEASKQCRRNQLMEITEPMTWQTFLSLCVSARSAMDSSVDVSMEKNLPRRWWIAHPLETAAPLTELWMSGVNGMEPSFSMDSVSSTDRTSSELAYGIVAVVGPEGGFTDEEVSAAIRVGFRPLSLGSRILRIETAAIAIAAVEPPT